MNEITLICAMYNMENYVSECLQSIADQTYTDFELILIDDCSEDTTLQICRKFQKDHPELTMRILTNEKNLGVSGSLERGVLAATTTWIYIMDADDFIHPQMLEVGMKYIHSEECADVDAIRTQIVENTTKGFKDYQWTKITELPKITLSKEGDTLYEYYQMLEGLSLGKNFLKRELFDTVDWQEYKRKWPRRFFMDGLFSVALFHSVRRVGLLDGDLYIYRIRENSTGRGLTRYDHLRDWAATDVEMIKNLDKWNEVRCGDECLFGLMNQVMRLYYYMRENHVDDEAEYAFIDEEFRKAWKRAKAKKLKYSLAHQISFRVFNMSKNLWFITIGKLYFKGRYRTVMKTKFH